jgi:hypothetical protein
LLVSIDTPRCDEDAKTVKKRELMRDSFGSTPD